MRSRQFCTPHCQCHILHKTFDSALEIWSRASYLPRFHFGSPPALDNRREGSCIFRARAVTLATFTITHCFLSTGRLSPRQQRGLHLFPLATKHNGSGRRRWGHPSCSTNHCLGRTTSFFSSFSSASRMLHYPFPKVILTRPMTRLSLPTSR